MTTTAQSIVLEVQNTLQDLTGVRWPASELVRYLNLVQRQIASKRPDKMAATASFVPAAGAKQALPAAYESLMDIPRNTSGNKRAMTKVDLVVLDATLRDWQSLTGVTEFSHFCHDPREPRAFYLYPPAASSGASIELVAARYPTDVAAPTAPGKLYTTVTGNVDVPDEFSTALKHGVLFHAYSKDAEFGGNAQLAAENLQMFKAELGEQLQSAAAVAPKD